MHRAKQWAPCEEKRVKCSLCHHRCLIKDGTRGICGVRKNVDGILYSLVYGRSVAQQVDPIEKKPLYHFLPGSAAFSIATLGCNFRCLHCQNIHISKVPAEESLRLGEELPPKTIVAAAEREGCESIAYTYTEPTIFFEYAFDTAVLAAERGLKNVFITNGYITSEALDEISPHLDAANIDLKFFDDETYQEVCGARLAPILESIQHYYQLGIWIEITTLVIPTYNDSDAELRSIAEFIAGIDSDIPWHISRFAPAHLMQKPRTSPETLYRARDIGRDAGLNHVYIGNLAASEDNHTRCPACRAIVVERGAFGVSRVSLDAQGCCGQCGHRVTGIWQSAG